MIEMRMTEPTEAPAPLEVQLAAFKVEHTAKMQARIDSYLAAGRYAVGLFRGDALAAVVLADNAEEAQRASAAELPGNCTHWVVYAP